MISATMAVILALMTAAMVGISAHDYSWGVTAGLFCAFLLWMTENLKDQIKDAIHKS